MSPQLKVAPPSQIWMEGGTPSALCPPVTASDCRVAVIVPRWHESPQEIPPTKRPSGWNVGTLWYLDLSAWGSTGRVSEPCDAARNAGGRNWVVVVGEFEVQ
ncbi:hypothetical protein PBY51_003306 [Eleginops maclovinus]|uniref:Uncharacterized protein n=1 Tax=Eleginops maclovinus TaxID=56733 RepID=A0AAN7XEP5_ELEMC|nr:hypothetical protein PBY51_003306 [Eleginops maclovinus]